MEAQNLVHFGPYQFDPTNACVWRDKHTLPLRPKAFAVLEYLLNHAGQLVTKDELFEAVWPGVYVTEGALKECIREIRRALKDKARTPQFVETVHRRGYRFIGHISEPSQPPQPAALYCVGREAELSQLQVWWQEAYSGKRQVVFLVGEAGIGKTTVLQAFLSDVPHPDVWVGLGQCIEQYGSGEAYMPILEALGRLCRQDAQLIDLLEQHAPSWLVQMPALLQPTQLDRLQARVGGMTQERMLREMAEAVEVLTAQHPLVFAVEDLQWSDTATVELIAALARRHEPARLFIIATYRLNDVLVQDHPLKKLQHELQMHAQCQEVLLAPLSREAVGTYLTHRFPESPLPTQLTSPLHQRTEGNPLFLVNTVDYLAGQGLVVQAHGGWELNSTIQAITDEVPDTLRQMIRRQIEYLPPQLQQLLEVASIAGATFSVAAVAAGLEAEIIAVEDMCEVLAWQGQFLEETGVAEWPDGTLSGRYTFRHTVYQEVLYTQIAETRRIRLHRLIGDRVEAAYAIQADALAAELALHFERGRDYPRALHYLQQAAANARRRFAYQETVQHFRRALDVLPRLPDPSDHNQQACEIHMALSAPLAAVKGWGHADVEDNYRQAQTLGEQQADRRQSLPILFGLWLVHHTRAELAVARDVASDLLEIVQQTQHADFLMEAHHAMGNTLLRLGELETARLHLEYSAQNYAPPHHISLAFDGALDGGVASCGYSAWVLWHLGYPDQAKQRIQDMFSLAHERTQPLSLAWAYNAAVWLYQLRREPHAVHELAEHGLRIDTDYGFAQLLAAGMLAQGWALVEQSPSQDALARLQHGLTAIRTTGTQIGAPWYLGLLAQAYGTTGQAAQGLPLLAEAFQVMEQTGERLSEAECHRLQGELVLRQATVQTKRRPQKPSRHRNESAGADDPQAVAEACFQQALAIARQQQAKVFELRAATSLARLWQQQGKTLGARDILAPVYNWFTEGFDTTDLKEAKELLDAVGPA